MNENKKIGIFTTFYNFDSSYSLTSVVRDQLLMLIRAGYSPVLFVLPSFKDDDKVPAGTEIRKVVPQIILEPYKEFNFPKNWKDDVKKIKEAVEKNCADITHLICHDIFFIDTYLPYNIGLREANIKAKFYAWTHSAPSNRPVLEDNPHANRYTLPPRTKLVYLNHTQTIELAEMYGAWVKDVRVVPNAKDVRTFWELDPLVLKIIDKYGLLEKDIISVYPLSTPRMISGKGLDKAVKLHSKLKELGYKTCLIVPNAHANAERDKQAIASLRSVALEMGLDATDLVFTSLEDAPKYESGISAKAVSDLFRLSNIFIFPTISENCSLVLLEAQLAGNLCVLNKNVRQLAEFGGHESLYFDFDFREGELENERYYLDLAKIVGSEFENSRVLQAKRRLLTKHNLDYCFKKYLEPLFYDDEK